MLKNCQWQPILTDNVDNKCWLPILTTSLTTNVDYRYWLPMLTTYCIDNAIWSNITKWLTKSQLVTHWLSNMVWRLLDQETLAHQKIETGESLFRERTPLFCEIHSSLGGHLCPNAGRRNIFSEICHLRWWWCSWLPYSTDSYDLDLLVVFHDKYQW